MSLANQGVRVRRVSDNAYLDGLLSNLVKSTTLFNKDLFVCQQKVSTLHAWAAGPSTDEASNVDVLEAFHNVSSGHNIFKEVVRSILKLHHETIERLLSKGQLHKVQDDSLVGSEHASLGNHGAQVRANKASRASDSDSDRGLVQVFSVFRLLVSRQI